MTIGKKLNIAVILVSVISLIIGFIILTWYTIQIENDVDKQFVQKLQQETNYKLNGKKNIGITNAISIGNDGRIKKALRTNDRTWAIKTLGFIGVKMKKSTQFKNIKVHVHTKDNKSFVRIWKLKKFGDDLSSFRHSIVEVNKTLRTINTFELGKAGLSLRSVVPITDDDGTHLGSLEFMQGLNSVAKAFDKNGDGFMLLMDKRVSSVEQFKAEKIYKTNYIISQKFINQDFLNDAKKINIDSLLKNKIYKTDKFLYTFIDIKDFRDIKLGIAIVGSPLEKVNFAVNRAKQIINIALFIIVGLIIFILISVIISIKKLVALPLKNFSDGILGFFDYLNRKTIKVALLDNNSDDEIGIMAKIVNKNIIRTKDLIEQDKKVINEVKQVLQRAKTGIIKQKIEISTSNKDLEELKNGFNELFEVVSSKVSSDLNEISDALNFYKDLDFTHRIDKDFGEVSQGLNSLADIINKMLVENKDNGLTLQNSANALLNNVATLSSSSNQAAASLEETAAALEEITSNIANNTNNVIEMASHGNEVKDSVLAGQKLANQTTVAMDEINTHVSAISEAISVIDQIAFQTNILSLNAAVEAATAGEAGKGFAVVAQEVRNLANRSSQAADEIKGLVENATQKADNGKHIAKQMIDGYTKLNQSITKTLELISDIEMASKEQHQGIEQINSAVAQLDQQTQKNASIANATHGIATQTQLIAKTIVDDVNTKEFLGK